MHRCRTSAARAHRGQHGAARWRSPMGVVEKGCAQGMTPCRNSHSTIDKELMLWHTVQGSWHTSEICEETLRCGRVLTRPFSRKGKSEGTLRTANQHGRPPSPAGFRSAPGARSVSRREFLHAWCTQGLRPRYTPGGGFSSNRPLACLLRAPNRGSCASKASRSRASRSARTSARRCSTSPAPTRRGEGAVVARPTPKARRWNPCREGVKVKRWPCARSLGPIRSVEPFRFPPALGSKVYVPRMHHSPIDLWLYTKFVLKRILKW